MKSYINREYLEARLSKRLGKADTHNPFSKQQRGQDYHTQSQTIVQSKSKCKPIKKTVLLFCLYSCQLERKFFFNLVIKATSVMSPY